ncbi:hypothetical protein D9M70_456530 [compost metagenome]
MAAQCGNDQLPNDVFVVLCRIRLDMSTGIIRQEPLAELLHADRLLPLVAFAGRVFTCGFLAENTQCLCAGTVGCAR